MGGLANTYAFEGGDGAIVREDHSFGIKTKYTQTMWITHFNERDTHQGHQSLYKT